MPDEIVERLRLDFPRVTFHEGKVLGGETLAMIDAAFVTEMIPDEAIERMPRLRWLHGTYGSVSSMLTASVRARPILLTSSSGLHAVPFAEFTIAAIFALAKRLPTAVLA
jgi:phosphoglycerate dehydrogenase-like enzyme